jgi:hypothetical protein
MNDTADEIARALHAAFDDVKLPRVLDARRHAEVVDMGAALGRRPWQELTLAELVRHRAALGMLDAEAFRYYLPAYLLASLDRDGAGFSDDLRHAALWVLSPRLRKDEPGAAHEQLFLARVEALDEAQRAAIRRYLRFVRAQTERPGAFSALDPAGYWAEPA